MIIEKIEIDSFASLRGVSFDLTDGINLIEGNNESGKSSIADFIKFILYGAAGKAVDDHLAERKRVMNFNDSHIGGSMTVRVEQGRYKITRNLAVSGTVRESVRTRISVRDCESGADIYEGVEPGVMFLGIPEDVFCASAYLSQRGTKVSGADINESISNILFSGDERTSAQKAIERIDSARIPLSHKHGKVGRIYDIREELYTLESKLASDMEANERIIALEAAVGERKKTNAEHQSNYELLEKQKKANELARLIEKCEAVEGAERAKIDSEMRLLEHKATAHIPTDEETAELRGYERSMALLEKRATELSLEREQLEREREVYSSELRFGEVLKREGADIIERVEKYREKAKKLTAVAISFFALAAVVVGISFLLPSAMLFILLGAFAVLDVGIGLIFIRAKNVKVANAILRAANCSSTEELARAIERYRKATERITALSAALDLNKERTAETRGAFSSEKQRLVEFLADMDIDEAAEDSESLRAIGEIFAQRQRTVRELEAEAREKRAYYEALLTQTENVDLERTRAELEALGVAEPLSFDVAKLDRNIKFYREQSELLCERIHAFELELTELRARSAAPAEVREHMLCLESELAECERKHAVYTLAAESLKVASEELRRSVAPALARVSGEYMGTLTDGKYGQLSLDHAFALSYESGGELRHIDHMSTGTRDMAYLSLRLALADVISGEGKLVLMLDEATAHMDDTRAKNLLRLLVGRATDGAQHILFTCHGRESQMLSEMGAEFNRIEL